MSRSIGSSFGGYHSPKFDFGVKGIISKHTPVVINVKRLMKEPFYLVPPAKIRRLTNLRSKQDNEGKLNSAYNIRQLFQEFKEFITSIDDEDVEYLIPVEENQQEILTLLMKICDFDTMNIWIQNDSVTLCDHLVSFDADF